jgi:hypothetical protein
VSVVEQIEGIEGSPEPKIEEQFENITLNVRSNEKQ